MRVLSSSLRRQLESAVLAGRRAAESAARSALEGLGVFSDRRPEHLDDARAGLRNGLRAKWRQLGNNRDLLVSECAYEQWHRLLFARFLAENSLLLHPTYRAPVTLGECEELAADLGEPDGWSVAARFAAEILPGIFRLNDPCVRLRFAPEGREALERILVGLPSQIFGADDALGWVYQFWQRDKKDEVNASERKIGGSDLGPVTQLFTENYMVRFLLENSLGAWWAGRHPSSPLVKEFDHLRFDDGGKPAAGAFAGWPDRVAEVTVMDPCCGSGHFLVEAFSMLWRMRAEEEQLNRVEAQDAVLRDNLFGLELDPRCVQIAMFAVALQAWKTDGKWRPLPVPNIACSGIPAKAPVDEWKKLAGGDLRLESALARLNTLFREADTLGSLLQPRVATEASDPSSLQGSFDDAVWQEVAPLLERASAAEETDPALSVLGMQAIAIQRALVLLDRTYTLLITNPPFLSEKKQSEVLLTYLKAFCPDGSPDLATSFLVVLLGRTIAHGHLAMVTPVNWQFQGAYVRLRRRLLKDTTWSIIARLGTKAFSGGSTWDFHTLLVVLERTSPTNRHSFYALDVSNQSFDEKGSALRQVPLVAVDQEAQLGNPDARIVLSSVSDELPLLEKFAAGRQGIKTGDDGRFRRKFWEQVPMGASWSYFQSSFPATKPYAGRSDVVRWEGGKGAMARSSGARIVGKEAWGRQGVMVSQMGSLPASLYDGELFDTNASPLIPKREEDLGAIWQFCSSGEYGVRVREIDSALKVTNRTLVKVPFDVERWRRVAEKAGPLPRRWSDDPTQWLFEGRPETSTAPLQVAVGRLLGYRWPAQPEGVDDLDKLADPDGIACIPPVAGEPPAAERLQQILASAYGAAWSPGKAADLLGQAGSKRKGLGDWLRDEFFKEHCALFANRPFAWHIWDGRLDGFGALVNYHRLDRRLLEKLTYTYLGQDWVERQRSGVRDQITGADGRLSAALQLQRKLEAILSGDQPFDIYVRWKEFFEQPIGWEPDLNDGVRLNIRPFVEADVLRSAFNIHWRKDRGVNTDGSERSNDDHMSLAEKRAARMKAGRV
jgi:hypothetical protein